ncbi:MAG: DNA-binding protein [Halanaerobiales bacterium]|nr:DNA-binding protein [Halanaerobiales bacterium]
MIKKFKLDHAYLGRIEKDKDLLKELTKIVKEKDIKTGTIKVIGAVQNAKIGFYDQAVRKYEYINIDSEMEIVSCIGNISNLDGKPFIHAHIVLADDNGKCFGGHLSEGTKVFASEFIIQPLIGNQLERKYDKKTDLKLW